MSKLCVSKVAHSQDGHWSWLVCFAATMSWMAAMGFVFSFGIFFPVFTEFFGEDRERVAWVGSLSIAMVFFIGPVSGFVVRKFGCRLTSLLGGLICASSLAFASLSSSLLALYLSYSLPFGIGTSFIFSGSLVIVSNYFEKRRSLALGFTTAGLGLGVLVQGPLLQQLIDKYGWITTYRIMSGVLFGVCLLGLTYDPNVNPEGERDTQENVDQLSSSANNSNNIKSNPRKSRIGKIIPDVSVWKVPAFVAITLSSGVAQFGHYVPQIHLVQFCGDLGITADKASRLYVYYGLTSAIARIPVGHICDVRGMNPFYLYQSAEFVVGLSTILVTLASDYTTLIVFTVIYGLCDGVFITTLNIILMSSVEGTKRPAALGWQMQVASIFLASGPPVAGLMADKLGSYDGAFYMAGSVVIFAAGIPFLLLFTKRRTADRRLAVEGGVQQCLENTAANLEAKEGASESSSYDVNKSAVIKRSPIINKSKLSCTKANGKGGLSRKYSSSGDCRAYALNLQDSLPQASQLASNGFVNKSFTMSDEVISCEIEILKLEKDLQAEIDVRVPQFAREDEKETVEQLQYDTRL